MRKKLLIPVICLLMLTICTGCSGAKTHKAAEKPVQRGVFAMDTYMDIKAYGSAAEASVERAEARIRELEEKFSVTLADSDISRINSSRGAACDVSEDTADVVRYALEVSGRTKGALDISMYPVLRAWGFTTQEYRIPKADELAELLENTGWERIVVSGNSVSVPEGYMLDLGALAKGFTSDALISLFRENGVDSAIVSLGGNVQTLGKKPDGSLWKVAVRDPAAPDSDICVVSVADKAVVTSGNYERFFIGEDGTRYCHIIDPKSGCPVQNGLASVTVIGGSGLECDALSTALFVMGEEDAVNYWRSESGFELILVMSDGRLRYTEGLKGNFEAVGNRTAEVIERA